MKNSLFFTLIFSLLPTTITKADIKFGAELADIIGFSFSLPLSADSFGEFNLGWRNLNKEKTLIHSLYYLINNDQHLINSGTERMNIYYGGGYKLVIDEQKPENETQTATQDEAEERELEPSLYLRGQVGLRYQNEIFELFFSILPDLKVIPDIKLGIAVSLGIRYALPSA